MPLKSINYWSFPGGLEGSLGLSEFLRLAKESGFDGAEVAIGEAGSAFGLDTTEERCKEVLEDADRLGISVVSAASGLFWSRSLADSDSSVRAQALEDLKKMLQIASWLKVKTLLTIPGSVDVFFMPDRKVQDYSEVWNYATEGLRAALPTAQGCDVRMGIENVWNRFLLSPHEMASFIDQFASPYVGAYVDVANLLPFGYAEQWLRILGKRVVGIHFKDYRRAVGTADGFVDLLEGDVDWPAVMAAIREIEYEGPVVAEMIPLYKHYPLVRIANASNAMDAILGS